MSIYRILQHKNAVVTKHYLLKGERIRKGELTEEQKREREEARRQKFTENEDKIEQSISRAKRIITEIALCNDFDWFCTFEFRAEVVDRYNLEECSKKIRQYFNNFKKRYAPKFEYLIVPELHPKTGAYHFHGLIKGLPENELTMPETILCKDKETGELIQIPNKKGYMRWERYSKSCGYFDCSRVKSPAKVSFYIQKYIVKECEKLPKGTHLYFYSRGLEKAKLIYDGNDDYMALAPTFENEYCKIAYDIYEETFNKLDENGQYNPFDGEFYNIDYEGEKPQKNRPITLSDYGSDIYNDDIEVEYEQEKIHSRI